MSPRGQKLRVVFFGTNFTGSNAREHPLLLVWKFVYSLSRHELLLLTPEYSISKRRSKSSCREGQRQCKRISVSRIRKQTKSAFRPFPPLETKQENKKQTGLLLTPKQRGSQGGGHKSFSPTGNSSNKAFIDSKAKGKPRE